MTSKKLWQLELEILVKRMPVGTHGRPYSSRVVTQEVPDEHLRALRDALVRDDQRLMIRSDVPFQNGNEDMPTRYDPLGFLLLQAHPDKPLWWLEECYYKWMQRSDSAHRLIGWLDRHQDKEECFADLIDAIDTILLTRQRKSQHRKGEKR